LIVASALVAVACVGRVAWAQYYNLSAFWRVSAQLQFQIGVSSPTPPNPDPYGSGYLVVSHTYTVKNVGSAVSGTMTASLTGTNPTMWSIATNNCTGTLAPNATCTIIVHFNANSDPLGSYSANIQVTATPGGTTVNGMTGTVIASPANLAWVSGSGAYGTQFSNQVVTFTLQNTGGTTTGSAVTVSIVGTNPTMWSIGTNNCTGTLGPGASCTVQINFLASSDPVGTYSATLQATATSSGTPTTALTGTVVTAPVIAWQVGAASPNPPNPDNYGTYFVGDSPPVHVYTLKNTGGATSGTISISETGANPSEWGKTADSCNGTSLGAGASCTVTLQIYTTTAGSYTATLQATAAPGGTTTNNLTGYICQHDNTHVYNTGSGSVTIPTSCNSVTVSAFAIGGGGAGGYACNTGIGGGGGGGGGGQYVSGSALVSGGTVITYAVGASGFVGSGSYCTASTNGGPGGTSTVGAPLSLSAAGGQGGIAGTATIGGAGGAGGGGAAGGVGTTGSVAGNGANGTGGGGGGGGGAGAGGGSSGVGGSAQGAGGTGLICGGGGQSGQPSPATPAGSCGPTGANGLGYGGGGAGCVFGQSAGYGGVGYVSITW
jgi:hypothetical protein